MWGFFGGEWLYLILLFVLVFYDMIEVLFWVMDEFDVFMDVVSCKISFDIVVNFVV